MLRKNVIGLLLTTLLASMLTMAFHIQPVKAWTGGTIYIHGDGSFSPSDAPIHRNGDIYTFTDDIMSTGDGLVVSNIDNIVVDGAGYTFQGSGSGTGIHLYDVRSTTIMNVTITDFDLGIYLFQSSSNHIIENSIFENGNGIYSDYWAGNNSIVASKIVNNTGYGIDLRGEIGYNEILNNLIAANAQDGLFLECSFNNITGNNITANDRDGIFIDIPFEPGFASVNNTITENKIVANNRSGIHLNGSSNNTITRNNIKANEHGLLLEWAMWSLAWRSYSEDNTIAGNSIEVNNYGVQLVNASNNFIYHNNFVINTDQVYTEWSANIWDDGCEGNYWSDYTGVDLNNDGIGDTPYFIDVTNRDNYPLMGMWYTNEDMNNDGVVNILDITIAAKAYGSYPGHPRWNCRADINRDAKVNILDIAQVARKFR